MFIDYDGLQHDLLSELERSEQRMLSELRQAMRDGEVAPCQLSYGWAICDTCNGHGGHSRRLGLIDAEAWNDWDDDQRAFYMGGGYNAPCERCNGSGKVAELAVSTYPAAVRAWIVAYQQEAYESAMICHAERRAGC